MTLQARYAMIQARDDDLPRTTDLRRRLAVLTADALAYRAREDAVILSPFTRRALARELPGKVLA